MLIALTVVALLGAGVVWALARVAHAIARADDWDDPLIEQKRESWK